MPKPRRPRTVLGFDHGNQRIGVAVGQEITASAWPLVTLKHRNGAPDWDAIDQLLRDWQPDLLVLGVPRRADGSASTSTEAALAFGRALETRSGLPLATIDERLSSHAAEQRLRDQGIDPGRDKAAVDRVAAALILETWLHQADAG
ncbi:MAG: Holliday junction resolvase RuvX [Candidatus Competibacterales bacterium]|nr:Holliday junction resolvase RuvX [Candidatus Competibacterales bacterium]